MLPEKIKSKALTNGDEYAWRRKDLRDAVLALEDAGLAISYTEAWLVCLRSNKSEHEPKSQSGLLDAQRNLSGLEFARTEDLIIYGAFPTLDSGGKNCVIAFDVGGKQDNEDWKSYVSRSATETLSWVEREDLESKVLHQHSNQVFYNVTFISEFDE